MGNYGTFTFGRNLGNAFERAVDKHQSKIEAEKQRERDRQKLLEQRAYQERMMREQRSYQAQLYNKQLNDQLALKKYSHLMQNGIHAPEVLNGTSYEGVGNLPSQQEAAGGKSGSKSKGPQSSAPQLPDLNAIQPPPQMGQMGAPLPQQQAGSLEHPPQFNGLSAPPMEGGPNPLQVELIQEPGKYTPDNPIARDIVTTLPDTTQPGQFNPDEMVQTLPDRNVDMSAYDPKAFEKLLKDDEDRLVQSGAQIVGQNFKGNVQKTFQDYLDEIGFKNEQKKFRAHFENEALKHSFKMAEEEGWSAMETMDYYKRIRSGYGLEPLKGFDPENEAEAQKMTQVMAGPLRKMIEKYDEGFNDSNLSLVREIIPGRIPTMVKPPKEFKDAASRGKWFDAMSYTQSMAESMGRAALDYKQRRLRPYTGEMAKEMGAARLIKDDLKKRIPAWNRLSADKSTGLLNGLVTNIKRHTVGNKFQTEQDLAAAAQGLTSVYYFTGAAVGGKQELNALSKAFLVDEWTPGMQGKAILDRFWDYIDRSIKVKENHYRNLGFVGADEVQPLYNDFVRQLQDNLYDDVSATHPEWGSEFVNAAWDIKEEEDPETEERKKKSEEEKAKSKKPQSAIPPSKQKPITPRQNPNGSMTPQDAMGEKDDLTNAFNQGL